MNLSNLTRCSRDFIPSSRSSRASSHSINSSPLICSSLKESLYCARPIRWSSFRIYRTQTWQRQCAPQFQFCYEVEAPTGLEIRCVEACACNQGFATAQPSPASLHTSPVDHFPLSHRYTLSTFTIMQRPSLQTLCSLTLTKAHFPLSH